MKIAIIDAEIIGKSKHRFPNLACMKISAYHKKLGDIVTLKTDYDNLDIFDKIYISKVFTKTRIPCEPDNQEDKTERNIIDWYADNPFLQNPKIVFGGTGFFFDKAPPLPDEIEHIKPDYHLYDEWIARKVQEGVKQSEFDYYINHSIGFLTRKCFRGCYYCVNRNCRKVEVGSPPDEFVDEERPYICLLDDNFFGHPKWKTLLAPVIASNKRFKFKQGLDERLLTEDKLRSMELWKYDKEFIFAFDNIEDRDLIISKLKLIKQIIPDWKKELKFYVFCGCDKTNTYDAEFFHKDITDLFERISILIDFGAKPYVMRHEDVYKTEFSSFYAAVSAWCNQPSMFNSFSFRMFCFCRGMRRNGYKTYKRNVEQYLNDIGIKGSEWRSMEMVENLFPDIANKYFDLIGKR